MLSSFVHFSANSFVRRHWFWLINALLLLYLWTLSRQTQVAVTVSNGLCTASVPGRTLTVECPELRAGSRIGLYLPNPEPALKDLFTHAPLDWLAPDTAWQAAALFDANGEPVTPLVGMPLAKPLLAQCQWLLQVALRAHQGALLLLLAAWLLSRTTRLLRRNIVSPPHPRTPAPLLPCTPAPFSPGSSPIQRFLFPGRKLNVGPFNRIGQLLH